MERDKEISRLGNIEMACKVRGCALVQGLRTMCHSFLKHGFYKHELEMYKYVAFGHGHGNIICVGEGNVTSFDWGWLMLNTDLVALYNNISSNTLHRLEYCCQC